MYNYQRKCSNCYWGFTRSIMEMEKSDKRRIECHLKKAHEYKLYTDICEGYRPLAGGTYGTSDDN